ncbi:endolytic transglycosylase MltG [Alteromonas sp. ASW11-36]|uniref:Endolytic murein transglycosylase n=1 Tax=Alteromonas arenosi TaxID=3055817 RepID=A0ABT7SX30_9ALTE|nr:endolytic transglycosylase MltG [Alteromonas sp. ASW11-36]MDM7860733.1 endolytic transglycosylase MltG [Alteromonas sp. ASW11-36]
MRKNLTLLFAILFAVSILAGLFVLHKANNAISQTAKNKTDYLFTLDPGTSLYQLMSQLDDAGVYQQSDWLKIAFRLQAQVSTIKAGTYEIAPGLTLTELLQDLYQGNEKQFSITLIEGLRWRDWLAQLNDHEYLVDPLDAADIAQWLSENPVPGNNLEGWLLPDTYAFTANTPVIDIVERAHRAMQTLLEEQWQNRFPDLPYEASYDALIMASIIEKETGVAHEREHIAGVFVNRLNKNMRLQTDPTVIYGIGESFDGNITRKHLRTPTPYNTYVIKGLPPTPIAMPGKASVLAAFNPLITDDLYFVSKGDGTHFFSSTLEQHNQAVREYQLGIK